MNSITPYKPKETSIVAAGMNLGGRLVRAIIREFDAIGPTLLDDTAWIVKFDDGQRGVVMTLKGRPYVAQNRVLRENIIRNNQITTDMKRALKDLECTAK